MLETKRMPDVLFTELYQKLGKEVEHWAKWWLRNNCTDRSLDADDVMQEIWLAMMQLPEGMTPKWYLDTATDQAVLELQPKRVTDYKGDRFYAREIPISECTEEDLRSFYDGGNDFEATDEMREHLISDADGFEWRAELAMTIEKVLTPFEQEVWALAAVEHQTAEDKRTVDSKVPESEMTPAMKETVERYPSIPGKKYHGYTQEELAEHFGVTQQYISQVIEQIKSKLRAVLK